MRRSDQMGTPAESIFLLFNGLNEDRQLRFYYELASALLFVAEPLNVAVIIVPTPGHLTRYPIPGDFTERPLDRYLNDPGDLFRQFLRLMVETEWLLAAIGPLHSQSRLFGLPLGTLTDDLLDRAGRPIEGPASPDVPSQIGLQFHTIWRANYPPDETAELDPTLAGQPLTQDEISSCVSIVRDSILGPEPTAASPAVNLVGYSLGGFYAQSVLFTWPSIVASCTCICSGGPLGEILLTEFATPQEWQSVLHGLRYEISEGLLQGRISRASFKIPEVDSTVGARQAGAESILVAGGIPESRFSFLVPIFHDVFLQDSRGHYATRANEYKKRMLFVVGGDDPIISSATVLDSGPQGGNNLVQIANLGHFVHNEPAEFYELIVPRLAFSIVNTADDGRAELLAANPPGATTRIQLPERIDRQLSSDELQHLLDGVCEGLAEESHLFVSRTRPLTVLLGEDTIRHSAVALHYSSGAAEEYAARLLVQQQLIRANHSRLTLLLSLKGVLWAREENPVISSRHSMADGRTMSWTQKESAVERFHRELSALNGAARYVSFTNDPELGDRITLASDLVRATRARLYDAVDPAPIDPLSLEATQQYPIINAVPDCWIFLNEDALHEARGFGRSKDPSDRELPKLRSEGDTRSRREDWFLRFALDLMDGTARGEQPSLAKISAWVREGSAKIFQFSRSRHDPSYRGLLVRSPRLIRQLWTHTALAYCYSRPVSALPTLPGR